MTKQQAIILFKSQYREFIIFNRKDKHLLNETWAIFTDCLCKDGQITDSQYNRWSNIYKV